MSFSSRFDAFHEQAAKATGLDDFGTADYVAPLKLLLTDYDKYCRFSPEGEQLASAQLVGLLSSRLIAQQGFTAHPEFTRTAIHKPVIILGMPRTGSTSLHRLLAKDPGVQCLTPWLGNTPMPRPPSETWESNLYYQATAQGLEQFYQMYPAIKAMHPMAADQPDECRYGMEPSFWSPGLAMVGPIAEYADWIHNAEPRYAYDYYRKILGLIAGGDARRWVLKDPTTHLWAPRTMLEAFPDACFVYTHRDPVTAISSVSNMCYQMRHLRLTDLTPEQNGRDQLALWAPAIEKTEQILSELGAARVVHMHIDELRANPVGTAERIYRHFSLQISEAARTAWQRHAETDAKSGHGAHHYSAQNMGLNAEMVRASMPVYYDNYQRRYGTAG